MNIEKVAHRFGRSFKNPHLLACIPATVDGRCFQVRDPGSDELLVSLPECTKDDLHTKLGKLQACFDKTDFSKNHEQRAKAMLQWGELIHANLDDIALVLSLEGGKIYREAVDELKAVVSGIAAHGSYLRDTLPRILEEARQNATVYWRPLGVHYAVTPWNFPAAMVSRKLAPPLAAGCPVIIKPDHRTPLCCIILVNLAIAAGFSPDAIQVVLTSDAGWATGIILSDPLLVQRVSFTGSTRVGEELSKAAGARPICLELGGQAPFIIDQSADIGAAVDGVIRSRFRHTGQTCICANRLLIHSSVYERVLNEMKARINEFRVGHQLDDGVVHLGPLIDTAAIQRIQKQIDGFRGEKWQAERAARNSVLPTLLLGGDLLEEELFGPVLAVHSFASPEEAVNLARSRYGLAGYVYAEDPAFTLHMQHSLKLGMLGVNTENIVGNDVPFSGCRLSGHGIEGSPDLSIRECMRPFAVGDRQ